MKIQVVTSWVVTPTSDVVASPFGDPRCFHLQGEVEDAGSMTLRNVGTLPYHYSASEYRKPRLQQK
jgi:hypothetical protein